VLQYHSGDKYATAATEAKVVEYGVRGFPSMYFNGKNLVSGGSTGSYAQQTAVIDRELAKTPSVAIGASMSLSGGITVNITVSNTSTAVVTTVKLYVILYEDLGIDEHHYTVRDIVTPLTLPSLAPGASQDLSAKSSYTGSTTTLNAVVYVKASNGEILQAALAKIG
jgi:hypothetical protein